MSRKYAHIILRALLCKWHSTLYLVGPKYRNKFPFSEKCNPPKANARFCHIQPCVLRRQAQLQSCSLYRIHSPASDLVAYVCTIAGEANHSGGQGVATCGLLEDRGGGAAGDQAGAADGARGGDCGAANTWLRRCVSRCLGGGLIDYVGFGDRGGGGLDRDKGFGCGLCCGLRTGLGLCYWAGGACGTATYRGWG